MQDGFFFLSLWMNKCLEMANDRHFWNPGVVLRNDTKMSLQLKSFFFF
jgi:hypothetical protein